MKIYDYHYSIRNIVLTMGGNYTFQDGAVSYMMIQHDYIHRIQPIIKIKLEMSIEEVKTLYDHKDDAVLKMDLYEYEKYDQETIGTNLYLQHSYRVILAHDINAYTNATDNISQKLIDPMQNIQAVEMYLIDMDVIKYFTQKITTLLSNTSKAAAIQAMFQLRNVSGVEIIATPPTNDSTIANMSIPFDTLTGNIRTINNIYGVYSCDPIIYYDGEYLYCIDWLKPNIEMKSSSDFGNIVLMLDNDVEPDMNVTGSYNDPSSKTHFISMSQTPTILENEIESSSTQFATITTVDSKGNVQKDTVDSNATAAAYVYNENPNTANRKINESQYLRQVFASFSNTSIAFLKPYKIVTFQMGSQYSNLQLDSGNTYRIEGWTCEIIRETVGENPIYIHSVTLNLREVGNIA